MAGGTRLMPREQRAYVNVTGSGPGFGTSKTNGSNYSLWSLVLTNCHHPRHYFNTRYGVLQSSAPWCSQIQDLIWRSQWTHQLSVFPSDGQKELRERGNEEIVQGNMPESGKSESQHKAFHSKTPTLFSSFPRHWFHHQRESKHLGKVLELESPSQRAVRRTEWHNVRRMLDRIGRGPDTGPKSITITCFKKSLFIFEENQKLEISF